MNRSTGRTKVLQVFGTLDRGGAELRTLDLVRAIGTEQFQYHFCALSGLQGTLDGDFRALGGVIHYLDVRSPLFFVDFARLLRRESFQVVHSHVHYFSGALLRQAHRSNVPVRIAHFRSTSDGRPNNLRRRTQRRVLRGMVDRHATHILGVSEAVLRSAWCPDWEAEPRCSVIRNGLNRDGFVAGGRGDSRSGRGRPQFVHVGSFQPAKNHRRLLQIFLRVLERRPTAELALIGGRGVELQTELSKWVNEHGITKSVSFLGERSDVIALLQSSDAFVFPSLREGSPGALLEAIASSIPVVASDIEPNRELARFAPQIRLLGLYEDDETWASALIDAAERKASVNELDAFWTEFDVRGNAEKIINIWRSA